MFLVQSCLTLALTILSVSVSVGAQQPTPPIPKVPSNVIISQTFSYIQRGGQKLTALVTTFWSNGNKLQVEPTPIGEHFRLTVPSPSLTQAEWDADGCTFSCLNGQSCGPNGQCFNYPYLDFQVVPGAVLAGTCNGPATQLWNLVGQGMTWCYQGDEPLWYAALPPGGKPLNFTIVQWSTLPISPSVFNLPQNCTCPSK
jgi:hypothetical protein